MDSDDYEHSDVELDDDTHNKLVNNVLNLTYKQHVKKVTRSEPTLKISEFDLVKTGKNVHISDLADVLERKGKQYEISKKIKRTEQKGKTLPKPLEKPHAERIHRTVAYKKTQNELGKWDPIVSSIRSSAHTAFPLHCDAKINNTVDVKSDWGYKTDLQKDLEALAPVEEVFMMEEDGEFPMSMEEIMEKRREAAKLRAHESYKIAKSRRQNKIKSKKYHRIQKREKVKQQMKEFELLQKTNPEAALEKLEEIERARAEERMSLRHKSTGQWARSKLIRAKYDRESRQVLGQQLAISRDLTQKINKGEDSDSEPDASTENTLPSANGDNPWVDKNLTVSKEVGDFVSGYRKYWEQQNGVEGADEGSGEKPTSQADAIDEIENDDENIQEFLQKVKQMEGQVAVEAKNKSSRKEKAKKKATNIVADSTSEWEITDAHGSDEDEELDLENEFNKLDGKIRKKVQQKLQDIGKNKEDSQQTKATRRPRREKRSQLDLLALPKQNLRPDIDEELDESAYDRTDTDADDLVAYNALKSKNAKNKQRPQEKPAAEIDPNKFMHLKPTMLDTAIPDLMAFDDNEEADQRGVISEAFQDDDIVDNFQKDKMDEIDKNNPKSIDLSLPGWGCWGGKNVKMPSKKKKRFIVKFPEKMARKDCNKGDLIINEHAAKKVKAHLVSEVPFPFKNVKDYEASIRAPIGNTFVPETAFRRLTKPAVTTKLGTVIEPMNEEILVKKKNA